MVSGQGRTRCTSGKYDVWSVTHVYTPPYCLLDSLVTLLSDHTHAHMYTHYINDISVNRFIIYCYQIYNLFLNG